MRNSTIYSVWIMNIKIFRLSSVLNFNQREYLLFLIFFFCQNWIDFNLILNFILLVRTDSCSRQSSSIANKVSSKNFRNKCQCHSIWMESTNNDNYYMKLKNPSLGYKVDEVFRTKSFINFRNYAKKLKLHGSLLTDSNGLLLNLK